MWKSSRRCREQRNEPGERFSSKEMRVPERGTRMWKYKLFAPIYIYICLHIMCVFIHYLSSISYIPYMNCLSLCSNIYIYIYIYICVFYVYPYIYIYLYMLQPMSLSSLCSFYVYPSHTECAASSDSCSISQ